MQIIAFKTLKVFWTLHPKAEQPLKTWYAVAKNAQWKTPADIRLTFNSVDFVAGNRVIFNIGGNNYRMIARIVYDYKSLQIKFIGTHAEYEKINPVTVEAVS